MEHYNDQIHNEVELEGAKISIIGVGGGGGNALHLLKKHNIQGVRHIVINTDYQHLNKIDADIKISIGKLGAGAKPEVGKQAVEAHRDEIKTILKGQDMIFITAGMGGGTGTGAAPIIAEIANELGILTIAIVTKPFDFEGKVRIKNAEEGITELKKYVDAIIVVQNQKLLDTVSKDMSVSSVFDKPNEILINSIKGIVEIITKTGKINIDFADVNAIMRKSGETLIGFGETHEGDDILKAVENAIKNNLVERDLKGAENILINITLPESYPFMDVITSLEDIKRYVGLEGNNVMFGLMYEEDLHGVKVTLIATSFIESETVVNQTLNSTIVSDSESSDDKPIDIIFMPDK